jgi:NAD(P)-dependent dehydrogenase (short-subunit alcohol dehydrogenase family)
MTRMYPSKLPANANRGEADLFALIRDAAGSESYACLHSLGLTGHERKEYAEADFVVVGPAGLFVLEVKGGTVERSNGIWTIGSPGKTYQSEEGPFAQAQSAIHPLRKFLKAELGLGRSRYLLGWGVAFPHTCFRIRSPEWDSSVVYDDRDLGRSFMKYIERLEAHFQSVRLGLDWGRAPQLSKQTVSAVVSALRGDFELTPTIRSLLGDSRRELASLSASQFQVLDLALNERNPRLLCDGAAGTGKTLIGMEAARRLAAQGKRVLLLCFNTQLGRFLANDASEVRNGVTVATVHRFMTDAIRRAGLEARLKSTPAEAPDHFTRVVPELFEEAAFALIEENELPQYDAMIIDEAQDVLSDAVVNALDLVLKGGFRNGRWLVLLDTGLQARVYARLEAEVLERLRGYAGAELVLTENFRNPKAVVREMIEVVGGDAPACRRLLQSTVDYRRIGDDADAGRKLKALLVELIRAGAAPGSITILSARARDASLVVRHPPDTGKAIVHIEDGVACPPDSISASTVSGFKGLENEIIILTDVPPMDPLSDWGRAVLYVGMTRARSKLFMLVDEAYLDARTR